MRSRFLSLLVLGLVIPWSAIQAADVKKPASKSGTESAKTTPSKADQDSASFLRVTRDDNNQILTLDTSIVRYVARGGGAASQADPRVNERTADGRTPLHLAAAKGHKDVVVSLLAKGAQVDAKTNDGMTPLHLAAEGGYKEIVDLLLTARRAEPGLTIDLIGAVHIGDKSYYQQLNKEFEDYDAMLYELVAPQGTRIPKNARPGANPLALMQSGMGNLLELDYQLTNIDYQKPNFVHADMSPDQFAKSMQDRGESFFQMMLKSMGQQMAKQGAPGNSGGDAAMLLAFMSKNRSLALKRALAQQFESLEGQMELFGGPDGSTIITERNKVVLKVLGEQIKAGKKKIAIFYGAGHMADMEERLLKEFGVEREGERWLVAWDMRPKAKAGDSKDAKPSDDKNDDKKASAAKAVSTK